MKEKLIEEAAKAIMEASHGEGEWEFREPIEEELYLRRARAALAVFEKALTPTDDEREALSQIIKDVSANTPGDLIPQFRRDLIVSKILAAGFRRSEVPEPSAEVLSDWFTSSHGVAVAAVKPMTDRGPSVMVDGRVISPNDVAALIEFKAQGEPSDAQVLAALNAYNDDSDAALRDWSPYKVNAMRAALRAAGGVR